MSELRMWIFKWIGLPLIAVLGLVFGSRDVIPSWDAMNDNGTVGTFTAVRKDCGRRSCSFYGDWVSSDGATKRPDVIIYGEPDSLKVGGSIEALDTGARSGVYTKGNADGTFYLALAFSVGGLAAAIGFVFMLYRMFTRRRDAKAEAAPAPATA